MIGPRCFPRSCRSQCDPGIIPRRAYPRQSRFVSGLGAIQAKGAFAELPWACRRQVSRLPGLGGPTKLLFVKYP